MSETFAPPNPWRMIWVTFAWGSCYLAISVALRDAPPLWLAALRTLIAGVLLLVISTVSRVQVPRGRSTWLLIVTMGLVNVALAYGAMFGGLTGMSTGAATVLANAQPLLILLPAWWLFGEKPGAATVAAMLLGLAGLLLIAVPNGFGLGAVMSLASAVAITAGTLLARTIHAEPLALAAGQFVIGGTVLTIVALLVEGPPRINWSPGFVISMLYMAVIGTAASNVAWIQETRRARLDQLTTWTLLVPVFGIILSVLVLRENQTAWAWSGIGTVIAALVLVLLASRLATRPTHGQASDRHRRPRATALAEGTSIRTKRTKDAGNGTRLRR